MSDMDVILVVEAWNLNSINTVMFGSKCFVFM